MEKKDKLHLAQPLERPGVILYNPDRKCPKCGHNKIDTQYCYSAETCPAYRMIKNFAEGEHIHKTCTRCKFQWPEKCINEFQDDLDKSRKAD